MTKTVCDPLAPLYWFREEEILPWRNDHLSQCSLRTNSGLNVGATNKDN